MPHNFNDQGISETPPSDASSMQIISVAPDHLTPATNIETPPATILETLPNCIMGYAHFLYQELLSIKCREGDGCELISEIIEASKAKWHTTIYEQAFYSASKLKMHDVMLHITKIYPSITNNYWAAAAARLAIQHHDIDELEYLLTLGINPSFELPCNGSLIKIAFKMDDGDAAMALVNAGADLSHLAQSQCDAVSRLYSEPEEETSTSLLGMMCSYFAGCFGLFDDAE